MTTRHFHADARLHQKAAERASARGMSLGAVIRDGLERYGAESESEQALEHPRLGAEYLVFLANLWKGEPASTVNDHLAALHDQGWSYREIAEALVASGACARITRQAVALRVQGGNPSSSPAFAPRRARRVLPSPGRNVARHDVAFRVDDVTFAQVRRRTRAEGVTVTQVVHSILVEFIAKPVAKPSTGDTVKPLEEAAH